MNEILYLVRVDNNIRETILQIVGSRETVIDTALRVMLDNAPAYDYKNSHQQFTLTIQAIR